MNWPQTPSVQASTLIVSILSLTSEKEQEPIEKFYDLGVVINDYVVVYIIEV